MPLCCCGAFGLRGGLIGMFGGLSLLIRCYSERDGLHCSDTPFDSYKFKEFILSLMGSSKGQAIRYRIEYEIRLEVHIIE